MASVVCRRVGIVVEEVGCCCAGIVGVSITVVDRGGPFWKKLKPG